jgi:hypothetical protein
MPANTSRINEEPALKALSIAQPWAELILRRRKPFEIRSWNTKYRGLLLIHASTSVRRLEAAALGVDPGSWTGGAFFGWAELVDVRPFTKKDAALLKHKRGGDGWWKPNQFA